MAQYTQTYTFTNGTTADGGQVNTEIVALGTSVNNITNAQIASNAAIDASKLTLGTYTAPTTWTPTWTGFSVSPTVQNAKYCQVGKVGTVMVTLSAAGTSNATGFSITNLPLDPAVAQFVPIAAAFNNGTYASNVFATLDPGGTMTFYIGNSSTGWTASGNKYANFVISYLVA